MYFALNVGKVLMKDYFERSYKSSLIYDRHFSNNSFEKPPQVPCQDISAKEKDSVFALYFLFGNPFKSLFFIFYVFFFYFYFLFLFLFLSWLFVPHFVLKIDGTPFGGDDMSWPYVTGLPRDRQRLVCERRTKDWRIFIGWRSAREGTKARIRRESGFILYTYADRQ